MYIHLSGSAINALDDVIKSLFSHIDNANPIVAIFIVIVGGVAMLLLFGLGAMENMSGTSKLGVIGFIALMFIGFLVFLVLKFLS